MPSAQIRVIIVSGEPHFHRGLINVRIWIKINILTSCLPQLLEPHIRDREQHSFRLKVPLSLHHVPCRCSHDVHLILHTHVCCAVFNVVKCGWRRKATSWKPCWLFEESLAPEHTKSAHQHLVLFVQLFHGWKNVNHIFQQHTIMPIDLVHQGKAG